MSCHKYTVFKIASLSKTDFANLYCLMFPLKILKNNVNCASCVNNANGGNNDLQALHYLCLLVQCRNTV